MKKRGRPPKKLNVQVVGRQVRRSAFDLDQRGVKKDSTKAYRWSTPERVDEHKYVDGYSIHQAKEGERGNESGHVTTKGKMVLLERSKDEEERSKARKILRTEQQTRSVREMRRDEIEKLSSKHGIDLHKQFMDEYEKREDGG